MNWNAFVPIIISGSRFLQMTMTIKDLKTKVFRANKNIGHLKCDLDNAYAATQMAVDDLKGIQSKLARTQKLRDASIRERDQLMAQVSNDIERLAAKYGVNVELDAAVIHMEHQQAMTDSDKDLSDYKGI